MAKENANDKYMYDEINKTTKEQLEKLDKFNENKKKTKNELNENLKNLLLYIGFIGAGISAIAYLIITIVMIKGVSTDISLENQILFSVLGAVVGLLISFLLRNQGIVYAKQNEEAQKVMREYRNELYKTKSYKKLRTISYYIFWATIRDIFIKGLTIALSTWFVLYIFIEGSGEWGLLGLAIANILMFVGFGLVGLATIYDKYLEEHIPIIKEKISKLKEMDKIKQQKVEEEERANTIKELSKSKEKVDLDTNNS